jgi:hypothetical protein
LEGSGSTRGVYGGEGAGAPGKIRRMRGLPEYREECRREIRTPEKCVVIDGGEEKRAGEVTFRESAGGVKCLDCGTEE